MKPLPNGWENTVLSQIMDFKNGLNFTKSNNGEAIKIVGVGDFKDLTELKSTENLDIVYVDNTIKNEELLKNGDLLLVRSNGNKELIGRCLFFPIVEERLSFSGFTIRGRVVNKGADAQFISNFMQSKILKQQIQKNSGGTNISNLSQEILNSVNIMLPPLPEQTKIAQILGTWDNAIRTTEQLIANSELQKQALMQQLLTGKKRLLNDNGERFCGEWKRNVLKNILQISKGKQLNRSTLSKNGDYPVINGGITPSGYTERFNTNANTITISEGGNSCGFVAYQKRNFWCGGHCYAIINLKLNLAFTYHLLKFNEAQIMNLRVGSGLPNIQKKALEYFNVCYPMFLKEQQKIAAVLTAADNETETLKQTLCRLKTEKQALMQQLLTGKMRVRVKAI